MTLFLLLSAIACAICLGMGLVRIFKGPTVEDRMMSAQLISTTGLGTMLLLGPLVGPAWSVDLALLLALLSAISVVALTRRQGTGGDHV